MKKIINVLKRTRLIAASVFVLTAVSVLAGTVYAVTIDAVGEEVGDGTSCPFSWTIDTSQDSYFKPVTNISGKLGGADNSTQNVTTTGYSGNLYDNAVTVTLGGDTSGSSAFYNTNLVYTLTDPSGNTEYAKFRIFQDTIIPVGCDQATLDNYVSGLTVRDVADTYGVCETLTFTLSVPENGMSVTSMPMYTYIPVEIRQRIVDENGNYLRDADSSITTSVTRYQYGSYNSTDYTNNKYFYVSSNTDYYDNLTSASPSYVQNSFTASGASTKAWMAKGYYFHGLYLSPQIAEGYNFKDITYAVSSRTDETVSDGNDVSNDRRYKVSGFGNVADGNRFRLEYGDNSDWDSDYIAANKIVMYVNYTQDSSYVPTVTPGTNYSITVNSHFENVVNDDEHSQYIEIYNDTTQNPIARTKNQVAAAMPVGNTTPALNLKSNSKVSVKSVVVKDENGNNITEQAFGYEQYYTDFIESCKTSLFGFVELQNITGNITVDVTYDSPVTIAGVYNSNLPYFSYTIVTKGDVGPFGKTYQNDYEYAELYLNNSWTTYSAENGFGSKVGAADVFNKTGHYTMRDGGQITRYDYDKFTIGLDRSNYSYISDVKAYYNDTGEEAPFDFSNVKGLKGHQSTSGVQYVLHNNTHSDRSVTFVVTYKKWQKTVIYEQIRRYQGGNSLGSRKIRIGCEEGGKISCSWLGDVSDTLDVEENLTDSYVWSIYTNGSYGKSVMVDSDTAKFYFNNEPGNSIDITNFKVYALDVNNKTKGEQLAGEGCDNPQLTLSYSPARTGWQSDGWVQISGLKEYGGNIFVEADVYRYAAKVHYASNGANRNSFTITADDAFGAVSAAGSGGNNDNMRTSYTKAAGESATDHWMYSSGSYTITPNGDEIDRVELSYRKFTDSQKDVDETLTFTPDANGKVTFTLPTYIYRPNETGMNNLTVYFKIPDGYCETQVYPIVNDTPKTSPYLAKNAPNSNNLVEVSVYDDSGSAQELMYNTVSGTITYHQSESFTHMTSNNDSNRIYKIAAGSKVKVKNIYSVEKRTASGSVPQSLIDFGNSRIEFLGLKVYKASDFTHNSAGGATLGEEITPTRDGDYYVFTMPESGVRIVPSYRDHVRLINIVSNQTDNNNRNYRIDQSTLGSATLTADENNWFVHVYWTGLEDKYFNTSYAQKSWDDMHYLTVDGSSYTLTATPADSANYYVKSVKAYKYFYSAGDAAFNKIKVVSPPFNMPNPCDWLSYDRNGNITNEEITGVVGELSAIGENGARTCTVTIPNNLSNNEGNIVLWVEYAPVDTTTFAHFKYEHDTTSAVPFNQYVTLKSVFTGDNDGRTEVNANHGADVEAAVYDDYNAQYMNVVLGGNTKMNSAFYRYNLIYTLSDYTTGDELVKFRVYKDQVLPVGNYTAEQLNQYVNVSGCTFEDAGSSTPYVCEKATIPIKLTSSGLKLSYQSERLYIPVTIKQYVKDCNGEWQPADNTFTASLTKYFENSDGISDFAENKYFAKAKITDDNYGDSYGLNAAPKSDFTDSYTSTGAEESHFMLIENHRSYWQGFHIQPNAPSGYRVSDTGMVIKTYNSKNVQSNWGAFIATNQDIYDAGQGYRVQYHAENGQSMDGDYLTHMGGQRVEVSLYYEPTEDSYTSFTYNLESSDAYTPKTVFKGNIQYDNDGVVDGTNGNTTLSVPAYDNNSSDPKYLTMEVGGGNNENASIFHQTNLVYTLKDPNNNSPLLKFRIYRGNVEPVDNYSTETFDQYIQSASVEGYDTSNNSGLRQKATILFKVPQSGLSVVYTAETAYLPVTIKQYVLDSQGNAAAAGESFTAGVTKYYTGNDDFGRKKYFAKANTLTDSYGLSTASESDFTDNYTVTGASDTHYMAYINIYSGLYINPVAPQGYALATIQGKAFNPSGAEITNGYHKQQWTDIPAEHNDNGYQITHNYSSYTYLRGVALEIDVYYQPSTAITIKQSMEGNLGSGTLAEVKLTNTNSAAPVTPYKAFTNLNNVFADSVTLTDTSANVNETDEAHLGVLYRTNVIPTNKGVKPQLKIEPKGARNVSSVVISKKVGDNYVALTDSDYTVSGSGTVNGSITFTFNNNIDFGDDYLVEISYGNEKTFTVKAVMLNSDNSTNVVDTQEEFNLTKATITVTGQRYGSNGENLDEKAFIDKTVTPNVEKNEFTVTYNPTTVTSATNTRVTLNTSIAEGSEYVIANVQAFNDSNSDLHLVVPGTKTTYVDDQGTTHVVKDGTTYETCTLPSLTSGDNVTVIVYLAKVASVNVSVFNIKDDGTTVENGVPEGLGADAYINTNVKSNGINKKAIITDKTEGYYYTGDFDITYNPHSRHVSVLQGSKLEIFAQLPGSGDYVVKKVVTNGSGFENVSNVKVSNVGFVNGNLRETINTDNTTIAGGKEYNIEIYIEKAKSIFTKAMNNNGVDLVSTSGTVTMHGSHSDSGVIPFTKIRPAYYSQNANSYDAVTGSTYDYTTEAKAIRGTNISFDVKPQSQYGIKTVTVKRGANEESAQNISFSASDPAQDGTVTYTVADPMSYSDNLYVYVEFAVLESATVTIDFQYSDDFVNYKNVFDPDEGLAALNVYVSTGYYGTAKQTMENLQTGETYFQKDGIRYSFNDYPNYKFKVAAGNYFSASTSAFIGGKWYIAVYGETYIYNNKSNSIHEMRFESGNSANISETVWAGQDLTFRVRLVPMASIGAIEVDNNCYDNTPEGVRRDDSGAATISAHFPNGQSYNPQIPYTFHVYPSGGWTNSYSYGYNGEVVAGSVIDSVTLNYEHMVKPGKITKVMVYEFSKEDYGNKAFYVVNSHDDFDYSKATRSWDLTNNLQTNKTNGYVYSTDSGGITVERDMIYRVYVEYDLITVHNSTSGAGYVKPYLFFVDSPDNINLTSANSSDYELLTGSNRYDESIKQKSSAYYVLVSDLPKEDLTLTSASFYDYLPQQSVSIVEELNQSYTPRTNQSGITKYYYYYKINKDDSIPIDNSMTLSSYFYLRREAPPVTEETVDCDITVEQWNRDTYDGNYVAAVGQSAQFSVSEGKTLKRGNKSGNPENPLTISEPTGYMYSTRGTELTIKPIPMDGYNVEKVVISDYGTSTYYVNSDGEVKHTIYNTSVTVKIYYSRPLLRLSSTNEGNQAKATVDVRNNTTGQNETVLSGNTFTNGVFVTKNDNAQVIIHPLTYDDEGTAYYYSVASIRIGDAYNNTLTAYTESGGDVENDGYTVTKNYDGSEYVLTLNSVQKDKYIFIQLVGKEKIYTSNLQVNQQIKLAGTNEYIDCFDDCFGSVTVSGTLDGVDKPMYLDESGTNPFTFNNRASVEGTVRKDTLISFSATAPADYVVRSVEVLRNGESVTPTLSDGTYSLANYPAPDSGTTVINIKYALPTTHYKLVYNYQGRKGGNGEGSYTGDDAETDPKTYTVDVDLYPAETDGDKPTQKVIADHAPAVDDLYKDCKWTVTKGNSTTVNYDTVNSEVTVNAEQNAKTYSVEFFYTAGKDQADVVLNEIKLNSLAKDSEGKFIQAPEKSGDNSFGYWSVVENGKEIARCYNREFNLRVTGNYKITAMYTTAANVLSISDPRYTRQQYDSNGTHVDKLQVDFLLAYMESNGLLLNSELASQNGYSSGIVVEYFDDRKIDKDDEIGATLTDSDKAKVTLPATATDTVKDFIKSSSNSTANDKQHLLKYTIPNSYYNNKNRVDRAIKFNNSEGARHMVFRAYYYVSHVVNGETVTELTEPVTFYLYDIGNSQSDTTKEG